MIGISGIVFTVSLALTSPQITSQTVIDENEIEAIVNLNCKKSDGVSVDLRNIHKIYNKKISYSYKGKNVKLSLSGESLRIITQEGLFNHRIDNLISDEDIDIELNFAYLDKKIYLYWSETYQHKPSLHGLLDLEYFFEDRIEGKPAPKLTFCMGSKGFSVAH